MSQKGRLKQVLMALNFMVRTDSFCRISSPLYLTSVMTDGEEILKDVCASRLLVLQEVKNVVYEYATKPFAIGYRISPEESVTGGLRIEDTYKLLDRLISSGISYIHTSLVSINDSYPVESPNGPRTIELILNHIAGRVPVIAAGKIRTPSQAQEAISAGLPLVAIGKGLVINPEWVTLAESGRSHEIQTALNPQRVPELTIPDKLWDQIQASKGTGWFPLMD